MFRFLRSLFRKPWTIPSPADEQRPPWADELLDAVQKLGRSSLKQTARLEATLGQTDAQLSAIVSALRQPAAPAPSAVGALDYTPVFDALDALDEARAFAIEAHLAEGLLRVQTRLTAFLERAGYARVGVIGNTPDPRLMRIVGREPCSEQLPGTISRLVRAAIVSGTRVVREGEVIVSEEVRDYGQQLGN